MIVCDLSLLSLERSSITNHHTQVGLFVWDKHSASEEMETISRYGNDVIVLWDCEDPSTDIFLNVGLSLARALCFRQQQESKDDDDRFETHLKVAIPEIQRHVQRLDDIETWTKTILNNSEKILKRMKLTREKLNEEVEKLEMMMH